MASLGRDEYRRAKCLQAASVLAKSGVIRIGNGREEPLSVLWQNARKPHGHWAESRFGAKKCEKQKNVYFQNEPRRLFKNKDD